jgi:hypothetical protein
MFEGATHCVPGRRDGGLGVENRNVKKTEE